MDDATESLLRKLETSPTDLRKLVVMMLASHHPTTMIPPTAIARWERDDAHSWAAVRAWLLSRGIKIIVAPPIYKVPKTDVELPSRVEE